MKNRFRDMPIRQKLMVVIMVTTAIAMLLAGLGILIFDSVLFRGYLQRDLAALARIVADNTTAALDFEDPTAAEETLETLRARTHLVSACVYRTDGTVLASYARAGSAAACPPPAGLDDSRSTGAGITVSHAIILNGRRIGTLTLLYDLGEISERLRLYGVTVVGVLIASGLIAFLFSSKLRDLIATPISQLAQTSRSVSSTRDYGIRAEKLSGDELGVLVDAFNEMLAGIQSRDDELKEALLAREEALREARSARDSLSTTIASIGDAVISTDAEGRIVFANPVAQSLVRLTEAQMNGKHLDDVFRIENEFTRERVESPVAKVLRHGKIVGMANHTVLIASDGTEIPIDDSAAPIRGESGTSQGTVLIFRDVSARRRSEDMGRLLASIVESSEDAIIGHDFTGAVTSWNKGAERIFGYTREETLGQHASIITAPGVPDEMPEILRRIENGERVDQFQAVRCTKSGDIIHVSITVSPVHDAVGRVVGASKIARDITPQVTAAARLAHLNADLQKSNENLARSNEDLERFAFVASHDLQEPLRMITIYSQLLMKTYPGLPADEAAGYMANIVGGTARMRELLSDLLAYAEIGAEPEHPVEAIDLNEAIGKIVRNLKFAIDESGARIESDRLPIVNVHRGHVIPLFQNLIGNAIKYRSAQPPRIRISFQNGGGELRFAVADNGIGIAPQYHQKIFGAFKRLHGRKIKGTGIGLAICHRIVERYGGHIWVESAPGLGSTFIFTLPVSHSNKEGDQ